MIFSIKARHHIRKPALLLAGLMACAACMGGARPALAADRAGAAELLKQAHEHARKGDLGAAHAALRKASEADPTWYAPNLARAGAFLFKRDGIAAENELKLAMQRGASEQVVRHLMGQAQELQGDMREARRWLTGGPFSKSGAVRGWTTLGRVEIASGNLPAAGKAFDQALAVNPVDSELWVDIARLRFLGGEQKQALEAVERAVELAPENPKALQYHGQLTREQLGLLPALIWFERALKIAPNDVNLLVEYAATLGDLGRNAEMLAATRKILDADPDNPNAYFMQAVLAARAGKTSLARRLMLKTEGKLQNLPAALLVDGALEYRAGNLNQAIDRLQRLYARQPQNRQAMQMLARAMQRNGEYAEVVRRFRAAADRSDATPYLLTVVGRSLEQLDRRDEAAIYLNRAAQTFAPAMQPIAVPDSLPVLALAARDRPNDARAVIPYIRGLLAAGQADRALVEAKRLRDLNTGAADAHLLVGDVEMIAGRWPEASEAYRQGAAIRMTDLTLLRTLAAIARTGADADARQFNGQYLDRNPFHPMALRIQSMSVLDAGQWAIAAPMLRDLRDRIGLQDAFLMADLAMAELKLGRNGQAAEAAEAAYRAQPASPVSAHIWGMALLAEGKRLADAEALLEKAHRGNPGNGFMAWNLARAYKARGKTQSARNLLRHALSRGAFPERDQAEAMLKELGAGA